MQTMGIPGLFENSGYCTSIALKFFLFKENVRDGWGVPNSFLVYRLFPCLFLNNSKHLTSHIHKLPACIALSCNWMFTSQG